MNCKKLFLMGLLFSLSFLYPTKTFAHVLKSDKTIGAVLHINPEDDPIIGESAGFFFEFKDKENRFDPANCDCVFIVREEGKQIYSQPLYQGVTDPSLTNASAFYTFPHKGVYEVIVIGKPLTSNIFEPFTLTYSLRISREKNTPQVSSQNSTMIFAGAVCVAIVTLGIISLWRIKKFKKRKK